MTEDFGSLSTSAAQQALELLYDNPNKGWPPFWLAYGQVVKRGIGRFRFQPDDRADVLQEITFHLVKDNCKFLRKWDPDRGALGAYLWVKTYSVCLDYKRKMKDHQEFDDNSGDNDHSPIIPFRIRELLEVFLRVLNQWSREGLPVKDRILIEGRLDGKEYSDIAEKIEISKDNATTRFSRLRKDLRKRLENAGLDEKDLDWEDWKRNL